MKKKKTTTEKKSKTKPTPAKKKKTTEKLKPARKGSATTENPLGKKHTCYACGKKFYDLNRPQVICPSCGADQKSKPAQKFRAAKMKYNEFDVIEEDVPAVDEELEFEEESGEIEDETVLDEE